ncbi:hypothetical protein OAL13_00095 [bacterium]|nr:hypothetical protein [bacterium]
MNFRKRQTIHLSMEKTDVIQMSEMKNELGLDSFAEVQAWLLRAYREGLINTKP